MGPILASVWVAIAAPWGGVAYQEATLTNLTKFIAAPVGDTGDALQYLQLSLDSLANAVF